MTKKHFQAIADRIASRLAEAGTMTARTAIKLVAIDLANICAEANAHFDRDRFLTACGM